MNIHRIVRKPLVFTAVLAWTVSAVAQPSPPPAGAGDPYEAVNPVRETEPTAPDGRATPSGTRPDHLISAEKLFLECEKHSQTRVMEVSDAALCSGAYELLLKERFKGKFSDLMAWWNQEKSLGNSRRKAP